MIKLTKEMKEPEKVTSRDNRRLIHARKVRDGKVSQQIFIEGRRLVAEALRSDIVIDECFVTAEFQDRQLLEAVGKRTAAIVEIPERIFASIADTRQSQGIVLIAKRPETSLESIVSRLETSLLPIVIFLKEVNNPSNLGAILRVAEASGVAGVMISKNSADVYSPKALRGAMGASFRLPVQENVGFEDALSWAKEEKLTTTAADVSGSRNYTEIDWKTPRLVIFGSEAHGLDSSELEKVNVRVRLPMENGVESLNLAVSAGIILFEAKRQNA